MCVCNYLQIFDSLLYWCFELATRCLVIKICLAQEDARLEALHGEGVSLSEQQGGVQTLGDHHIVVCGMRVDLNFIYFVVQSEEQRRAGEVNLSVI